MTPLKQRMLRQIATDGPIPLPDYMAQALGDPDHGYYVTRNPLGTDFITAPEISQMFGEVIGLVLAQAWADQGSPAPCALVELGPGRGTLMADILRVAARVPGFAEAAEVHLIETSPTLRAEQAKRVPGAIWHDTVEGLPDLPLFVIANEFFDALPIRHFQRADQGWAEMHLTAGDSGALVPGLAAPAPLAALEHRLSDTRPGDVVETCALAQAIISALAARIKARGGAALVIDYGDWRSVGDTLQAMQAGAPADPFVAPGTADLTAHVDFEPLARAARDAGLWHSRLTPQGVFLERLGITARAQALAERMSGAALKAHVAAHRRLTHPAEMGTLFKVLGFGPTPLAGFSDDA